MSSDVDILGSVDVPILSQPASMGASQRTMPSPGEAMRWTGHGGGGGGGDGGAPQGKAADARSGAGAGRQRSPLPHPKRARAGAGGAADLEGAVAFTVS